MRLKGTMMGQQKNIIISGEPEGKKDEQTEKADKAKEENGAKEENEVKKIKKPKQKKKRSRNYLAQKEFILTANPRNLEEAIEVLKKSTKTNFKTAIEIHIALDQKPREDAKLSVKPDKNIVIHNKIGKIDDKTEDLVKVFDKLYNEVKLAKPAGKKLFIRSVAICTSMSPSIKITDLIN